jgi:ATP-dependent phosphoenolpyruvate carboxykinase
MAQWFSVVLWLSLSDKELFCMGSLSIAEAVRALAAGPQVHQNLPAAHLVESALLRGEARLASNGALVATTGARTGRSPRDKFTVDDATRMTPLTGAA